MQCARPVWHIILARNLAVVALVSMIRLPVTGLPMTRLPMTRLRSCISLVMAILFIPFSAIAGSCTQYYVGTSSISEGGPSWFVVSLDNTRTARALEYGSKLLTFPVANDGTYTLNAGVDIFDENSGAFVKTVDGVYTGVIGDQSLSVKVTVSGQTAATLSATRQKDTGVGVAYAGFYQGTVIGETGDSTAVRAVILPDGRLYYNNGNGSEEDIYFGQVTLSSTGFFSGSTQTGGSFSGRVTSTDGGTITGTVTESGVKGSFTLRARGHIGPCVTTTDSGSGSNGDSPKNFTTATHYLMTTSNSANITSLHIVNTSSGSQAFTGTLYNGNGDQLGSADVSLHTGTIAAHGRLILNATQLETLFGVSAWVGPAMLVVKGTSNFELMSKLASPSGLVSNTNCVKEDRALNIEGIDSSNFTYVRFVNTTDTAFGAVKGTLYDKNGSVIGASDVELLSGLAPRQAVWVNRDNFSTLVGATWNGEAMLEVTAIQGLKLLNLNLVNNETFFNFSCFEASATSPRVYLQTTSAGANKSLTHIINTSNESQRFYGTLYGGDGKRLGQAGQVLHIGTIRSKGRLILSSNTLETAFGVSAWSGPAILEITGSGAFELMTKLESPSGLISNTNCVREDQVHNIEGADSADLTYVRFINTGDTDINVVKGTLYDKSGQLIGNANQVLLENLGPRSAVWLNRNDLALKVGASWNGEALLEVSSVTSDLRLLNLNYINSETFFNFSCYEKSTQVTEEVQADIGETDWAFTGVITDGISKKAIPGARVKVEFIQNSKNVSVVAIAGSDGSYKLNLVRKDLPDPFQLVASSPGYIPLTKSISAAANPDNLILGCQSRLYCRILGCCRN